VDFVVALLLLYGAQCVVFLPAGTVLFTRVFRSAVASPGPGWRLLHLRPSARALVGTRHPLTLRAGELHVRAFAHGLQGAALGPCFDPDAAEAMEARGRWVWSGKQRCARGVTKLHALALASYLEGLRGLSATELQRRVESQIDAAVDLPSLRAAMTRVGDKTRWFGRLLDLYALLTLTLIPALVALYGGEPVLWRAIPVFAVLHLVTLACFARVHRLLLPGRGGELVESLFAASLFPPLLLRAAHEFAFESALRFHPAAVACALLPEEAARSVLRRELLRSRAEAQAEGAWLAGHEAAALEGLVPATGASLDTLFAAPCRQDPFATGYCPSCQIEYRRAAGDCLDCEVALVAFAGEAPGV